MPPTISVTVGRSWCLDVPANAKPAVTAAASTPAVSASLIVRRSMRRPSLGWGRTSDGPGFGGSRRAPREQAMLELGDQRLGRECDDADNHHRREDTVRVEVVLRVGDDEAEPLLRSQELAYDRADDREAERDVQAGNDPDERRRQHNVPHDLPARRAEHPRIGNEITVDLADALERVEEDDEEDEHARQ